MTIKKQKIVQYIPIIQILTLFCWIKYYLSNYIKWSDFGKAMLKMFAVMILINIPRIILHFVFTNPILDDILYWISLYPMLYGLSHIAVCDQEKHENSVKR